MKIRLMVLAAVLLIVLPAAAQDVSGKWEGTAPGPGGEMTTTFEFTVDGKKLTGTVESELTGKSDITDGKVDGNKIEFKQSFELRGGTRTFAFTGVLDGDELTITRTFEGGRGRGGRGGRGGGGGRRGGGGGRGGGGRGRGLGAPAEFTLTRGP